VTILNKQLIQEMYAVELHCAQKVFPLQTWGHTAPHLSFFTSKTTFGQAHSSGKLEISTVYIGTTNYTDLRDTIRHELAHLIAGIRQGHNSNWKRIISHLGGKPERLSTPTGKLASNMKRKWRLHGTTVDGATVAFHTSHTKQSKYLSYTPTEHRQYKHNGVVIAKFTYKRSV